MALKVAVVVVDVAVLVLSRVNFGPEPFCFKKMGNLVNDIQYKILYTYCNIERNEDMKKIPKEFLDALSFEKNLKHERIFLQT